MRRLGAVLIAGGAAIWTVGVVAWISGVWVTLPPDTVRVLVLSLAAVTGGTLIGVGALVARGRIDTVPQQTKRRDGFEAAPQLMEGAALMPDLRASTPDASIRAPRQTRD